LLLDKWKAYCIILKIVKKVLFKLLFLYIVFLLSFIFSKDKVYASELISPWSTTTSLPYVIASHTSFSLNNNLYVVNGSAVTGESKDLILKSAINTDGTISSWNSTSTVLPEALIWHSTVRKDNNVYVLGGKEENPGSALAIVNTVYRGTINSSGDIDSWASLTPLPENLAQAAAVVIGDRIYVTGGFNSGMIPNQDIYAATINPDGTISSWTDVGDLPVPLFGHGLITQGGKLIALGGSSTGSIVSRNNTYVISLDSSGFVSGWVETSSLPTPIYRGSFITVGNKLFSIGGYSNGTFLDKVYYTSINSDGTLGSWTTSSYNLPQTMCCGAAVASGDYIYYSGGYNGSSYVNTVYFTKIESTTTGINLSVPLLKQTSEPWQGNIYDSANLWNPANPTINRWGCVITSIAMVFRYYGITKLPDGSNLDPGTLNTWLKTQKDGYVRNGLVNWLAASRLSKLAKASGNNPGFNYNALEYKRKQGADKELLRSDLENGRPGILEFPGHFSVATGVSGDTFTINDTFYNRATLNDGYNNTFLSLSRFIPSNTDLSYIMLVVDENVSVELRDSFGNTVGEQFIQTPITNPVEGGTSGNPVKIIYYPQPDTGNYQLILTSPNKTTYTAEIYSYDVDGEVNTDAYSGILNGSGADTLSLNFNKEDSSSSASTNIVTFEEFYEDIATAKEMGLLKTVSYHLLNVMLKNIEKDTDKGKNDQALKKLNILELLITKLPKKDARVEIVSLLLTDLEGLRNYIKSL